MSKQLCRPPAPPQTAAPVIIFRTIGVIRGVLEIDTENTENRSRFLRFILQSLFSNLQASPVHLMYLCSPPSFSSQI